MAKETDFNLWDSVSHDRKEQPAPEKQKTAPQNTQPKEPERLKQPPLPPKPREDVILEQARTKMAKNLRSEYEAAIKLLEEIPGWKTADILLQTCRKELEERDALEARERSRQWQEEEQKRKKERRRSITLKAVIAAAVLVVAALAVFLCAQWQQENSFRQELAAQEERYQQAIKLKEQGQYEEAEKLLRGMTDYKDSMQLRKELNELIAAMTPPTTLVSEPVVDTVELYLGYYEQDGNTESRDAIRWQVLNISDGKVLVISQYCLELQPYDPTRGATTWKDSEIRRWLNEDFLNAAFSQTEQEVIQVTRVSADKGPSHHTDNGVPTRDKLFLLSPEEVGRYFASTTEAKCEVTEYVKNKGVTECRWWLRTVGDWQEKAFYVNTLGRVETNGMILKAVNISVRPAMWLDLSLLEELSK